MYDFGEIAFKRAVDVCMHYRIFIVDGGFEPACVTLTCFALQFHGFIGEFWRKSCHWGEGEGRDRMK